MSSTTFGSEKAFQDGWGMKRTLTGVKSQLSRKYMISDMFDAVVNLSEGSELTLLSGQRHGVS